MAKIDKYSGLRIIENKDDLQNFYETNNRHDNGAIIKLYDDETKELKNFELFDIIANDIAGFQRCGLAFVNLLVPYERIKKEDFGHINKFWDAVKGKINCYVCVNHKAVENEGLEQARKQVKWHLTSVIKANSEIDKVCEIIKDSNLSPLEALAFIHQYVGNIAEYHPSGISVSKRFDKDQFFVGPFDLLPEVVCMGYASLMKEIIDNLNMPGLSAEMFGLSYYDRKNTKYVGHARCYVRIKDNKYKLNQSCFCDPTWDGKGKRDLGTYSFFAMSNKCHNPECNSSYIYRDRDKNLILLDRDNFQREWIGYDPKKMEYNRSWNRLDQHMVEKAFFTMKQRTEKEKDFETLMSDIEKMTAMSYADANKIGFLGYIKNKETKLTRKEAKKIYYENANGLSNQVVSNAKNDEEVCL